jgi:hypothetical protein
MRLTNSELLERIDALEELIRRNIIIQVCVGNPQEKQALTELWKNYTEVVQAIQKDYATKQN